MDADYVVAGGRSACCIVKARLSEICAKVVLSEAGPRDTLPWIRIPAGMLMLISGTAVRLIHGPARKDAWLIKLDQRHAVRARQSRQFP